MALVPIIMGSRSDLAHAQAIAAALEQVRHRQRDAGRLGAQGGALPAGPAGRVRGRSAAQGLHHRRRALQRPERPGGCQRELRRSSPARPTRSGSAGPTCSRRCACRPASRRRWCWSRPGRRCWRPRSWPWPIRRCAGASARRSRRPQQQIIADDEDARRLAAISEMAQLMTELLWRRR